jgi:hypothetical protein
MTDLPKGNGQVQWFSVSGFDSKQEPDKAHLQWQRTDLRIGDVMELRILPEGDGDPPIVMQGRKQDSSNLLTNADLARELLEVVREYEGKLMALLDKAEEIESKEEHRKLASAVFRVIGEQGNHLLYPIYRRHKELIPESEKGETW